MAGFFNIPSELVKKADEETIGFKGLESGVYTVKVLAAYVVESNSSSAKSVTIQYQVDGNERIFYESLWYLNGQGENFYVDKKDGSQKLLPSYHTMLDFFAAAGVDINTVQPEPLTLKHYGTEGQYPVFKEFTGKVMRFGIRHNLKDSYQDATEVEDTQVVQLFVNDEGKTGGEVRGASNAYSLAAWEKMIAKKPTLDQRKLSKGVAATTEQPSAEAPKVQTW